MPRPQSMTKTGNKPDNIPVMRMPRPETMSHDNEPVMKMPSQPSMSEYSPKSTRRNRGNLMRMFIPESMSYYL